MAKASPVPIRALTNWNRAVRARGASPGAGQDNARLPVLLATIVLRSAPVL